ncbi:MAG: hypothetical protein HY564_00055, partial [Candidatus Jacksonbacteria bacterium]|nr:hypothetical protein [Candidatus Jacksonbacteria bacterium]
MLIHKKKLKTTLVTILILVPIVSGIVMFLPTRAFACQCFQPSPPKEELQKAVAVFSGTVVGIDKKKVSVGQGFFEDSYTATFDVERAWKGVSKKTITVNAGIQGGMCGYPFEEKESYIVYADGADENELLTSLCTRTNKLIFAHEDLKELGEGTTEFVQNTVPELPTRKFDFFYYGGFNFWYYFGIGMFVVGLIAIIFIAFLLFKHKQSISVFLKRRFLLIVAFAASVIITGAAVYQITNLTLKQEQKQTLESMRSAFSEQIGDLKIENRKLKGTIETLEKAVPESPQACTSALTKSGDDPILQTIIEASPLIAHVKITSIGGG